MSQKCKIKAIRVQFRSKILILAHRATPNDGRSRLLRYSPADFGTGSDRGGRDDHGIASLILLVNIDPAVVVVPVAMWTKAQPVGEADRFHIHGHSAS